MDFELFFTAYLITLFHTSSSFDKDEDDFFKQLSYDEYYDSNEDPIVSEENEDKLRLNDKQLKINDMEINNDITEKLAAKYDVTENIEDIPNNITTAGPVITNFTLGIPLNNATIIDTNNVTNNNKDIKPNAKRNYISIFHIKAEYDNDKPEITVIQNNRPNFPGLNGFREYIKGVRQGILNSLQNFVNNYNNYNYSLSNNNNENLINNNGPDVHNIVNAPVVFWNKLQSKRSDVVERVRDKIFGRKFDNAGDFDQNPIN